MADHHQDHPPTLATIQAHPINPDVTRTDPTCPTTSTTATSTASTPLNLIHHKNNTNATFASIPNQAGHPATPPPPPTTTTTTTTSTTQEWSPPDPLSEPYPSFQSFFSLPSSPAERGMTFEQMLAANSAAASVNTGSTFMPPTGLPRRVHSPVHKISSQEEEEEEESLEKNKAKEQEQDKDKDKSIFQQEKEEKAKTPILVDGNNNPITSPHSVGSPTSDPSSVKTILSLAEYIPGTSRQEVEEECLDYRLKGRSRVSRGYSADFSTNNWTVASGSALAASHEPRPTHGSESPPLRGHPSMEGPASSEMLPLSEFLSQAAPASLPRKQDGGASAQDPAIPGYRRYSPPPTPPPPTILLSNQTGRIPITSAAGEFSGFQHVSSPSRDGSSSNKPPRTTGEGLFADELHPQLDSQLANTDSGVAGHGQGQEDEDEYLNQGKPVRNYKVFPGRNLFFCGGRIMTSRDFPAFLIAMMLLLVPTGLFHGFTSPYLWHRLSPAAPLVQAYLFIVAFSSMLKTSWTDPGVIPRGIDGDPPLDPPFDLNVESASFYPPRSLPRLKEVQIGIYTVRLKYCDTCRIYRPPRCSHCRQCDNCVEDEDHHCIWLNNCIGRRNYRYFLIFVSTAALYAFFTSALCLTHLLLLYHDRQQTAEGTGRKGSFALDSMAKAPVSAMVMVYATIMGLAVGALASYHFWLATKNRTTHEQLSASMMRPHVVDNPYDRGSAIANCAAVLCRPPTRSYIKRRDYVVA